MTGLFPIPEQYVSGEDVTKVASMCKLKAGRLAREVTDSCLQMWGGMGFTNEVCSIITIVSYCIYLYCMCL